MSALRQVGRIVLAYLFSAIVTGCVVYGALLFSDAPPNADVRGGGPAFALLIAFMIVWLASFPASVTILLGEWLNWRKWWPYAISGSLIGLGLGWMFQPPDFFPWLGLGLGVGSGAIYWLLAGQYAGIEDPSQRRIVLILMAAACGASFIISVPSLYGVQS